MINENQKRGNNNSLRELLDNGYCDFKNGMYEKSQEWFEKAIELHPSSAEGHAWLAAVYGRHIEAVWGLKEKLQWLSKLEDEVGIALNIDPHLPLARRMNGCRLLNTPDMLGGDPEAAIGEFEYCIEHGMDDADVWVFLAECYIKTDKPEKAIEALNEVFSREPKHKKASELLQQVKNK